jgi:hypothetical protein
LFSVFSFIVALVGLAVRHKVVPRNETIEPASGH